ncbi:glycoside hydrolase family 3 C-terminal domain-containing protein [Eisenbergiella sp.]
MGKYYLDMEKYKQLARQAVAEGCVLLKNENSTLPVKKGETVSVFGRIQLNYYKSGTGSGGLVNTRYVTGILDALRREKEIRVNEELAAVYAEWCEEHPFDKGKGWGQEPWSQEEMPLPDSVAERAAQVSDVALVIIGRTAGEDQDTKAEPGSYLLTEEEEAMIRTVSRHFARTAVLLNVGNIIDMKWVEACKPSAVLYVWQGGMEGGSGVADVLTGRVSPCGRLSDTIARSIEDYPSTSSFGDKYRNFYTEDIYVGYRYFETAAKDKVLYPFGFGLSYTHFSMETLEFAEDSDAVSLRIAVANEGEFPGRQVVQVYVNPPQGVLGKPFRSLAAFAKTGVLMPGEKEELCLSIWKKDLASYDDGGATGHKSCYVLEEGVYRFFAGEDVRSAALCGSFIQKELRVTQQLEEALAPVTPFFRLKPEVVCGQGTAEEADASMKMEKEAVPLRTVSLADRIRENRPEAAPCSGDKGIALGDVYDKKAELDDFLSQLTDEDLACIVRGEGMCSPKATPGTAGSFGGVTDRLKDFGIPVGCCADGPSGIRMDCGTHAFSLPNGTCLACTFNEELVEALFEMEGLELRRNRVDLLLGPGMNIHRNPLNGRNFEYFSEDPYLTGKMAAAQLKGMGKAGTSGTIKHFAGNNQEFSRNLADSVISERALREIYLKGFEIAVKEGRAFSIMSTYGPVNGLWTAGSYDLLTTILRKEWGFDGLVMTDWWAKMNDEGQDGDTRNTAAMVRGQNDVYMVVSDAASNSAGDNTLEGLADGRITRGELLRSARNICSVLMRLPVMDRFLNRISEEELKEQRESAGEDAQFLDLKYQEVDRDTPLDISGISTEKGASTVLGVKLLHQGIYAIQIKARCDAGELAQVPMSIFMNHGVVITFTINGTQGEWVVRSSDLGEFRFPHQYLKFYFGQSGLELGEVRMILKEELQ